MPPSRFTVPIRPATSGTPPSRPTAPISPCGPPCLQLPSSPAASGTMPLPASAPGAAGPGRAHGGRSAPCRPPHRGSGKWCSQGTVLPPLRGEAGLWRAGEQQRDGAALAAAEASKFTGQERFGKEKGFEPLQSQRVYLSPSENQQERSCSRAVCSASFCANPFSYRITFNFSEVSAAHPAPAKFMLAWETLLKIFSSLKSWASDLQTRKPGTAPPKCGFLKHVGTRGIQPSPSLAVHEKPRETQRLSEINDEHRSLVSSASPHPSTKSVPPGRRKM
ncbi:uncharacterized protein LOC107204250 isoform X2 [Parus major]|uniref:uncharacterized protein LOC107204250 isoform X2 n=1 Tax=Parus major TaxID=9157 RepID=UPI0007712FF6|nr:uncharacterized protein LOC107204250 isoform X2 [Parus major]